jgi:hypothetical protein
MPFLRPCGHGYEPRLRHTEVLSGVRCASQLRRSGERGGGHIPRSHVSVHGGELAQRCGQGTRTRERSSASPRRPSCAVTPACARASSSRAAATAAARSPSTASSTCAGDCSRPPLNDCKHPLYAERYQHTKRRLGRQRRPDRPRAQAHRSDLAHSHHKPAVRSAGARLVLATATVALGRTPARRPEREPVRNGGDERLRAKPGSRP